MRVVDAQRTAAVKWVRTLLYEWKLWRASVRCLVRRSHLMVPGQRSVYCWECFYRFYRWGDGTGVADWLRELLGHLTWKGYPERQ